MSLALLEGRADLEGEVLVGLEAHGLVVPPKELYRCTFRGAKLAESRWSGVRLEQCVFEDCDLTRLDPRGMGLVDVVFRRSKLLGVDFSHASNPEVRFEASNLEYATFDKLGLRRLAVIDCKVTEATFSRCDLVEADFSGSDLAQTTFDDCSLGKADFTRATGAFLDPARNRVKDAKIGLESAALVASSLGFRVAGFAAPTARARRR